MKKGEFTISHDQDYETIICDGCKREFILLNVIRSAKKDDVAVEQPECDWCPYCGRDMYLKTDAEVKSE